MISHILTLRIRHPETRLPPNIPIAHLHYLFLQNTVLPNLLVQLLLAHLQRPVSLFNLPFEHLSFSDFQSQSLLQSFDVRQWDCGLLELALLAFLWGAGLGLVDILRWVFCHRRRLLSWGEHLAVLDREHLFVSVDDVSWMLFVLVFDVYQLFQQLFVLLRHLFLFF